MKKINKIIVVCGAIIVGVIIGLVIYINVGHSQGDVKQGETKLNEYIQAYYNDTLENEVSVESLIENGYISNTNENRCNIYVIDNDKINKKETDCDKSKKLAKRPIIELITSDNFKLNEWNKNGGTIKVKLKNGGNSYYKEKDINSVEWYSIDGSINSVNNELEITDNMNTTLNVMINFDDVSYVKETKVMVDVDAPIYKSSNLKDSFLVTYEDNYFLNKKYYYLSENNEAPNKSDFKDRLEDLACDKTYNVWSYATDMAGNESEIQYLGNYTKCITISSGSVSEE